jgi:hypothetical protein
LCALVALGVICSVDGRAQSDAAPADTGALKFSGSILERGEFWDWFPARTGQTQYNYSGSLLQLAVSQRKENYDWMIDFAVPVLLNLPGHASGPAPLGQYGLGANYFGANQGNSNAAGFFLKQGFFRFKRGNSSVQLGRFEFADGMEGKPGDATLAQLKSTRIQQHLIGIFGFSDVRRSFDGVHYEHNAGSWYVTAVSSIPTRGVFQTDGWGWVKTPFVYAALTHEQHRARSNAEWRLFGIYYNDERPIIKTDNRSASLRSHDFGGINIGTFGGHYIQDFETSAGTFDLLAWGAAQTGKWGLLTQKSAAVALEAGFQPQVLHALHPWLRGGYFYSTGDGNPNDQTHGTFFTILPTPRVYARFPFYNEMNNRDAFGELVLRPRKFVTLRSDIHGLWLANSHDLWYSGGGAYQPWTFGFSGRPSNGATALARVYDTSADFQVNRAVALGLYFGYAQGGAVIQRLFSGTGQSDSNSPFGFVEVNYKF